MVVVVAEGDLLQRTPDIIFQTRIIDEGIAVTLHVFLSDGFVASSLHIIYRVEFRPSHQHVESPLCIRLILSSCDDSTATPIGDGVFIAGGHIEIDAGDVAFHLVVGLKHCTRVA